MTLRAKPWLIHLQSGLAPHSWNPAHVADDPDGNETHMSYDPSGRTTQVMDALQGTTRMALDRLGNVTARTDPDQLSTVTSYDIRYLPQFVTDPRTGTTELEFDGNGDVTRQYDAKRNLTERQYDGRRRLIRVTMAKGTPAEATVLFGYDPKGNRTSLTTPRGAKWSFRYDELDRLAEEKDPNGKSTLYEYDPVGNFVKMTSRNGDVTVNSYNSENEKIGITYNGAGAVTITRDPALGLIKTIADGTVSVGRDYDQLDRQTLETIPLVGTSLTMEYSNGGDRLALVVNGARSTYSYDALHRLRKLTHASGAVAEWSLDPIGLVTAKKLPNGVSMAANYQNRRLQQMQYTNALGMSLQSFTYQYDQNANITQLTNNDGSSFFNYDAQNRLTSASYPAAPLNPLAILNETFGVDASGNRVQHQVSGGSVIQTETSTFDAADQILSTVTTPGVPIPGGPSQPPTSVTSYTSDANGALTKIVQTTNLQSTSPTVVTTQFVFDARQRLVQAILNGGQVENFQYYPDSPLRLSFTAPGAAPSGGAVTRQLWDPKTQNPLQDLDTSNSLVLDYIMGNQIDEPLGRVAGGATHSFVTDHLMSVRGLADPTGALVSQYAYAAFGPGRSQVETVANRLRFTARELDAATGQQYTRNRYLALALGRWTQRDPIGFRGASNLYTYVNNDPLAYVDPAGMGPEDVLKPGLGLDPRERAMWLTLLLLLLFRPPVPVPIHEPMHPPPPPPTRTPHENCEAEYNARMAGCDALPCGDEQERCREYARENFLDCLKRNGLR